MFSKESKDRMMAKRIGENIKKARKTKGYTQKKLAELCNLHPGTIQQYELGKRIPRESQLIDLCLALDINLPKLLDDDKFHRDEQYDDLTTMGEFWLELVDDLSDEEIKMLFTFARFLRSQHKK